MTKEKHSKVLKTLQDLVVEDEMAEAIWARVTPEIVAAGYKLAERQVEVDAIPPGTSVYEALLTHMFALWVKIMGNVENAPVSAADKEMFVRAMVPLWQRVVLRTTARKPRRQSVPRAIRKAFEG